MSAEDKFFNTDIEDLDEDDYAIDEFETYEGGLSESARNSHSFSFHAKGVSSGNTSKLGSVKFYESDDEFSRSNTNAHADDDDPFSDSPIVKKHSKEELSKGGPIDHKTNEQGDNDEEQNEDAEDDGPDIEGMDLEHYMMNVMPVESIDKGDPNLSPEERLKLLDPMFRPLIGMSPTPGQQRPKWASDSFDEDENDNLASESHSLEVRVSPKASSNLSPGKENQMDSRISTGASSSFYENNAHNTTNVFPPTLNPGKKPDSKLFLRKQDSMVSTVATSAGVSRNASGELYDEEEVSMNHSLTRTDGDKSMSMVRSKSVDPAEEVDLEDEEEVEGGIVSKATADRLRAEIRELRSRLSKAQEQSGSSRGDTEIGNRDSETGSVASEVTALKSYASNLQKTIKQASSMVAVEALLKGIDLQALASSSHAGLGRAGGGNNGYMQGKNLFKKSPAPPIHPAGSSANVKKGRSLQTLPSEAETLAESEGFSAAALERIAALEKELRKKEERAVKAEGQLAVVATACIDLKKQVKALHRMVRQQEAELQAKDMRAQAVRKIKESSPAVKEPERRMSISSEQKKQTVAANKGRVMALEERVDELQAHIRELRLREKELVDQVLNLTHKNDSLTMQIKRSLTTNGPAGASNATRKYSLVQAQVSMQDKPNNLLDSASDGPAVDTSEHRPSSNSNSLKWARSPKGLPSKQLQSPKAHVTPKSLQSPKGAYPPAAKEHVWDDRFVSTKAEEARSIIRLKEKDDEPRKHPGKVAFMK